MAKTCDICGEKIGLKAFRCQDGVLCKDCYKLVSNNFTSTITTKTLLELKERYVQNAAPLELGQDGFLTTRKVGTFLLLDETNRKFCLPSNRGITGQYTQPEIFPYEALQGYKLASVPQMSPEQLVVLAEDKKKSVVIKSLSIQLRIAGVGVKEIVVIPTPVRSSSYAFRRAYRTAQEILNELEYLCVAIKEQ